MSERTVSLRIERVDIIPDTLEPGVLYVSDRFSTAIHLCPCGCGNEVVTPLGPGEWRLVFKDDLPTLLPSVGNWELACESHYWIRQGHVIWSSKMTRKQIERIRRLQNDVAEKLFAPKTTMARRLIKSIITVWRHFRRK